MLTPPFTPQSSNQNLPSIRLIPFEACLPLWEAKLWPNRKSKIETHSTMIYFVKGDLEVDMGVFNLPSWYYGAYVGRTLVGVNSGHLCSDGTARSRGLWVDPEHRRKGIGSSLLLHTANLAHRQHKATGIWSYPRQTSFPSYSKVGFLLTSEWTLSETSEANAYCWLPFNS